MSSISTLVTFFRVFVKYHFVKHDVFGDYYFSAYYGSGYGIYGDSILTADIDEGATIEDILRIAARNNNTKIWCEA